MHFTDIFILFSLAATASASPLGSRNIMLSKREGPDGQSGAQINAGTDVAFAFVYKCKTYRVVHTGFNAIKGCDGNVTDEAFYEWYPNPAIFIPPKTS